MARAKGTESARARNTTRATTLRLVELAPTSAPDDRVRETLWRALHPHPAAAQHENNVARVIDAALWGEARLVQRMADSAMGAKEPGRSLNARIVLFVGFIEEARRPSPRPEYEPTNVVNAAETDCGLRIFDGLERRAAIERASVQ